MCTTLEEPKELVTFLEGVWTELDFGDGTLFRDSVEDTATSWRNMGDVYAGNYCPRQEDLVKLGAPETPQQYIDFIKQPREYLE